MERMDCSQRTEYENALKDASFTAFLGKSAPTRISQFLTLCALQVLRKRSVVHR